MKLNYLYFYFSVLLVAAVNHSVLAEDKKPSSSKTEKSKPLSDAEVKQLIKQLAAKKYADREKATQKLMNADYHIITPLLELWGKGDLEYDARAIIIIKHLMWHVDLIHGMEIEDKLRSLKNSENKHLADMSSQLLRQFQTQREPVAINAIHKYDGEVESRVGSKGSDSYRVVELGKPWTGGNEKVRYLSLINHVTTLKINSPNITSKGFALLKSLDKLQSLNLNDSKVVDDDLKNISKLTSLSELRLKNTKISGKGLAHLTKLTEIESFYLSGTQVTDKDLIALKNMKNIQGLELDNTKITDAGLAHLSHLKNLRWLSLDKTSVSDEGLKHLHGLKNLRRIFLKNSKVTQAGEKTLDKVLPRVTMIR